MIHLWCSLDKAGPTVLGSIATSSSVSSSAIPAHGEHLSLCSDAAFRFKISKKIESTRMRQEMSSSSPEPVPIVGPVCDGEGFWVGLLAGIAVKVRRGVITLWMAIFIQPAEGKDVLVVQD